MEAKRVFLTTLTCLCVFFLAMGLFFGNSGSVNADETINKINDKDYIDSLRNNYSVEIIGNVIKTYDADTKLMDFSDDKGILVQFEILTPYENRVSPNDETSPVARFRVPNHRDGAKFFDKITAYDIDNGYAINPKSFVWKYLVETNMTNCNDVVQYNNITNETIGTETICYDSIETSWVTFNDWKQLPDGENEIGLFTTAILGEHIEFVFELYKFEVLEYASYLVTDLVSYYKMDDNAASTTVLDALSNNNGASSVNTNTLSTTGIISNALNFDGSTEYVLMDSGIGGDTTVSASFWFKTSDAEAEFININNNGGTSGSTGFAAGMQTGQLNILVEGIAWGTKGTSVNDNAWHHVVLTRNGNDFKVYLDGSSTPDVSLTNSGGTYGTKTLLASGSYMGGLTPSLGGDLDEVAIYSYVLNSTAISDLYNDGAGFSYPFIGPTCTFSGVVLDEGDNAIIGANVTIWNQFDVTEYYENVSIADGSWSIAVPNSTNTYMAGAYYNNTLIGQLKPYISGSC